VFTFNGNAEEKKWKHFVVILVVFAVLFFNGTLMALLHGRKKCLSKVKTFLNNNIEEKIKHFRCRDANKSHRI